MSINKPVLWDVDKLVPYDNNSKKHPQEQIDALANEIKDLGYDVLIVIEPDGTIIKGHGRRLAIMQLGWKQVEVIVRDDLTQEQMRRARLSDNVVADLGGGYDQELFHLELQELGDMEVDLSAFEGFGGDLSTGMESEPDLVSNDDEPTDVNKAPASIEQHDYVQQYNITIMAKDEAEQQKIYELVTENGYECSVQSM